MPINPINHNFKLGILAGDLAARGPNGEIVVNFSIGRLLEEIRNRIPQTAICLPLLSEPQGDMTYTLNVPEDAIVKLPPLRSTRESQRFYFQSRRILQRFVQTVDVLLVRLPFQLPLCLLGLHKPKLLHVISNPYEVIKASADYRGPMKFMAKQYALHSIATMRRLVAEEATRVVTNGQQMWTLLACQKGRVVVSSSIYQEEMKRRPNFNLGDPPRLLFVGYLRPEKGVETLLDAFALIRKRRKITLTLVGGADRSSGAEAKIHRMVREGGYSDDIEIKGMVDFGEALFSLYLNHDVFVLPSFSEGTPRTLVEARCFGCPVVATNVGGIPTSVEHNHDGLLVEPGQPEALAAAIESILDNDELRLRLIENGLQRTRAWTLERFVDDLVSELAELAPLKGR